MKFATFFTTLVASATAADNKAPVISLNLVGSNYANDGTVWRAKHHGLNLANDGASIPGGHPDGETNAYATECEITRNQPTGLEVCEYPNALAFDHHDGDVSVVTTYHTVLKSTEGAYVSSDADAELTKCTAPDRETCLDNFNTRAEYVIQYDAEDDDGNEAETVTFAIVVRDRDAPWCKEGSSQQTPYCVQSGTPTTSNAFSYVTLDYSACSSWEQSQGMEVVHSCVQTAELCTTFDWQGEDSDNHDDSFFAWANPNTKTYYDSYDMDRIANSTLYEDDTYSTSIPTGSSIIPTTVYADLTEDKTIFYEYKVDDLAGIFGVDHGNNIFRERGSLKLTDTIDPVINNINVFETAECGYVAPNTVTASYVDCFDSWKAGLGAGGTPLNDVEITDIDGTDWEVRRGWKVGGVVSASYNKAASKPSTVNKVDVSFDSATYSDFTLYFNVNDTFGNAATEETRDISVFDSLAPTLYITGISQKQHTTTEGHDCVAEDGDGFTAAGNVDLAASVNQDIKEKHCKHAEAFHNDSKRYSFYKMDHGTEHTLHNDTGFSTMLAETEIQHSAGYDEDYSLITDLLNKSLSVSCTDGCWDETTTTVGWVDGEGCSGTVINGVNGDAAFDMRVEGDYYLKYSCVDGSGWETTACRTFHNVDKTKPVITVLKQANVAYGHFVMEATRDSNYVDEGATCSDIVDGTISNAVQVSGALVDMSKPNNYTIKYNCKDSALNEALEAYRTVEIVDRTCPTCSMPTENNFTTITVEASFPYTDATVDCTDNIDGTIHNENVTVAPTGTEYFGDLSGIDVETVNTNPGYIVTYYSKDKSDNSYLNCYEAPPSSGPITTEQQLDTRIYRTVVVNDTLIPTIEIQYSSSVLNDRGTNPEVILDEETDTVDAMAENRLSTNGWVIGAVASAVSGVALLGYAATRKAAVATSVPV